jgi:cytochrome b561
MMNKQLPEESGIARPVAHYAKAAILFHWLVFALIFVGFPLGLYMHGLALSPDKLRLYSYHKWIGVTVFGLALGRLAFRALHPPPGLLPGMSAWERRAAQTAHGLLYAFMLMVPVSGWLMSSAMGFQTVWFGLIPLPDLIAKSKYLAVMLWQLHQILNFLMVFLILLHAAAALKHHFLEHDDTLRRMLPFVRRRKR